MSCCDLGRCQPSTELHRRRCCELGDLCVHSWCMILAHFCFSVKDCYGMELGRHIKRHCIQYALLSPTVGCLLVRNYDTGM